MKKILVTGSEGFVGKHLCDSLKNDKNISIYNFKGKLRNYSEVRDSCRGKDIVIHLACDFSNPKKMIENNKIICKNVINASIKGGVKKIIFISAENVNASYKGVYSKTKVECEKIISLFKNYLIIRPTVIYGGDGKRNLGFLTKLIKYSPIIFIIGDGEYRIYPLRIDEVVRVIKAGLDEKISGVYNLYGNPITFNRFIDIAAKSLKKKIIKIHVPLLLVKPIIHLFKFLNPLIEEKLIHLIEERSIMKGGLVHV